MKTSKVLSILLPVVLTAFIAFTGAYALQGCGGGTSDPSGGGDGGSDAGECTPNCDGRECGNDGCGGTCSPGCPTGSPCTAGKCETKACTCDSGFKCDSNDECILDPTGMWTMKLTNGTVTETDPAGEAWDVPGGMPDVLVCVAVNNGTEECSSTQNDTLTPTWNETVGTFTATALQAGVSIATWDEDLTSNDPICGKGTFPIKDEYFTGGGFVFKCTYSTVHFTLTAQ